jgi:ABC-type polysaccharide/polyol phosphate export permease
MSTLARSTPIYVASARRPGPLELLRETLREIRSRADLIRHLMGSSMRRAGVNTLLGNVWWVVDPLIQMPLYVLFVGVILRSGTPAYPLFLFSAILPWKWFTSSLVDASMSAVARDQLIKQVAFPKIVLPIAAVLAIIPQFFFGLIPLLAMIVLFYPDRLTPFLLLIPAVAVVQLVFTFAMAILLAILNVFARDTFRLTGYMLRLWFFLSPALYSTDRIEHVAARYPIVWHAFRLNPFTTLFDAYRALIYRGHFPDPVSLGTLLLFSVGFLLVSLIVFKRLEPNLPKIL